MRQFGLKLKQSTHFWLDKYLTSHTLDYKQVIGIIIPILVDTAFLVVMSLFNTAMVSSSGVAAISAVNMVDSLNIFIISVFIALATGGTVIVAQYKGSGNMSMVSKSATQAISSVALASLIIGLLVIGLHEGMLNLLFGNAETDVMTNAKIYLIGSCLTFPFYGLYQAVVGVLRGVGETKVCLWLSIIMNLTSFLLNLVFITALDMGVVGLVISQLVARFIGMASAMVYMFRFSHTIVVKLADMFRLDWSIIKRIMYIGVPFAAEQLFFNGGKLLTQIYIVQFGTLALTVNAISGSISLLFQIGASSLSVAVVTVVGQCIGRRDIQDARKYIKAFLILSSASFLVMNALILPLFPFIMQLFSPPEEIVPEIFRLTLLMAVAQPILWSISFITPSALRAAGDSTFTSIAALLSMWLIRVVLGYILGVSLEMGIFGVWLAMVIEWGFRGAVFMWRLRGNKWYAHKLID